MQALTQLFFLHLIVVSCMLMFQAKAYVTSHLFLSKCEWRGRGGRGVY
jgi:hypothetical protein